MRKILIIFFISLALVFFSANTKAEEELIVFNESTKISDDIKNLNLDLKDYVKINDVGYNRTYTVAIAESYLDDGGIDLYIYMYNSFSIETDVTKIMINNKWFDVKLITSDNAHNISKYRVENINEYQISKKETSRIYKITKFNVNRQLPGHVESFTFSDDFSCTITQKGGFIKFNIDSFIIITEKELVDYCFDVRLSFTDIFKYFLELFGTVGDKGPQVFFLNFDTNKKIDKILEIDVTYKLVYGKTKYCIKGNGHYLSNPITQISNPNVEEYTFDKPKTIYSDTKYEYDWFKYKGYLNMITSPAKKRFTEGELDYYLNDRAKESFTKRQHSVIIDAREYKESFFWLLGEVSYWYEKYQIQDAGVVRIKYQTDDIIFNARTNSGELIDSESGNIEPEDPFEQFKKWLLEQWNKFIETIKENIKKIAGIVIAIIFIIWIVIGLFKYGIKQIFKTIAKVFKSIWKTVCKGVKIMINGIRKAFVAIAKGIWYAVKKVFIFLAKSILYIIKLVLFCFFGMILLIFIAMNFVYKHITNLLKMIVERFNPIR